MATTPVGLIRETSPHRAGILGSTLAGLVVVTAILLLAWMLLLPLVAQERFGAATGAELRLQGLMADPFAGRATATGWILRAGAAPDSALLARGGAALLVAPGWRAAWNAEAGTPLVIESLDLHFTELRLAPDACGQWPLLSALAALGLPYEQGGRIGPEAVPLRLVRLRLKVDSVLVRDASTDREVTRPVHWSGEFRELDHSRPVVAALLAAARRE